MLLLPLHPFFACPPGPFGADRVAASVPPAGSNGCQRRRVERQLGGHQIHQGVLTGSTCTHGLTNQLTISQLTFSPLLTNCQRLTCPWEPCSNCFLAFHCKTCQASYSPAFGASSQSMWGWGFTQAARLLFFPRVPRTLPLFFPSSCPWSPPATRPLLFAVLVPSVCKPTACSGCPLPLAHVHSHVQHPLFSLFFHCLFLT